MLQEIKSRLDVSEDLRPPTPGHLTTLRIKSELGDQMYVLKMKHTETIRDVKKLLNKLRYDCVYREREREREEKLQLEIEYRTEAVYMYYL